MDLIPDMIEYGTPVKPNPTPVGPCPKAALEVTVVTPLGKERHYTVLVPAFHDPEEEAREIEESYYEPHSEEAESADVEIVLFGGDEIGDLSAYQAWHNNYYFGTGAGAKAKAKAKAAFIAKLEALADALEGDNHAG